MKKSLRISALIFTLALMLCSLIGCDKLDEMKAEHGVWNDDGTITYDGNVYKALPYCDSMNPTRSRYINITEKDVPVLLSKMLGSRLYISGDGIFIGDSYWANGIYCREDKYDEIVERIEAGPQLDWFCRFSYNNDGEIEKMYALTQQEVDAINEALSGTPTAVEDGYVACDHLISVRRCSQDLVFNKGRINILAIGGGYSIRVSGDDGKDGEIYYVPEESKAIFDGILQANLEGR